MAGVNRKTMPKSVCPECGGPIERVMGEAPDGKRVYRVECLSCGDVTEAHVHDSVRSLWQSKLDQLVRKEAFEFEYPKGVRQLRLRCRDCYTTYSHPVNYCIKCNGETVKVETSITVREWLDKAPDEREFFHRFSFVYPGMVRFDLLYPDLQHDDRLKRMMEILGLCPRK